MGTFTTPSTLDDELGATHEILAAILDQGRQTLELVKALVCEIARNTDPLRAVFASNPDPSALCVSIPPFGRIWPGRGLGDDVRGRDRRYPARLFRAAPAD
jgi:hypothetical protein